LNLGGLRALLKQIRDLTVAIEQRQSKLGGTEDPFVGVMIRPMLGGQIVAVEPKGPFKHAEDAADYLDAKRRAHAVKSTRHFAGGGKIEHDGHLYCHPDFTYSLLSMREYYATASLQIMNLCQTLLYHTTSGGGGEPIPLKGLSLIETPMYLAASEGKALDPPAVDPTPPQAPEVA